MAEKEDPIEEIVKRFYSDPFFKEQIEQVIVALEKDKGEALDSDERPLVIIAVGMYILIQEE